MSATAIRGLGAIRQRAFEAALAVEALLEPGTCERRAEAIAHRADESVCAYSVALFEGGWLLEAAAWSERAAMLSARSRDVSTTQLREWAGRLREQAQRGAS